MVARAKVVTAKWGVPSGEPDDLPDFMSNEEITDKMGGEPKGVYRVQVKKITVVKNKNDDDMLKIVAEINETDKAKKGYNGYVFFENQNVTEQSAPFLKQFLKSIGASWDDFWKRTKMTAETTVDPAQIQAIGSVKFTGNAKAFAKVTTRFEKSDQYGDRTVVGRWLPKADADDDADDEELDEEELDEDVDEEDDVDVEDDSDEEGDEEEAELREELEGLGIAALKKRAKSNDEELEKVPAKKADLIELIVEQELLLDDEEEPEDEEEEAADDEAEEELREELSGLTIASLKQRAKKNGAKVAVLRPIKTKEPLIDMIVEQELLGEDDEDDNEPPF